MPSLLLKQKKTRLSWAQSRRAGLSQGLYNFRGRHSLYRAGGLIRATVVRAVGQSVCCVWWYVDVEGYLPVISPSITAYFLLKQVKTYREGCWAVSMLRVLAYACR